MEINRQEYIEKAHDSVANKGWAEQGVEFLNILRNEFPDIKRIMLTANSDPELEMEARQKCDLLEFLAKPLDYEEIKEILCETIS